MVVLYVDLSVTVTDVLALVVSAIGAYGGVKVSVVVNAVKV